MNIIVSTDHNPYSFRSSRIEAICKFALKESGAPESSEVSVSFVDNDEMTSLNEQYRDISGPTDVLSFECDNLEDGFPTDKELQGHILGDIVIAPDVAFKQASELGSSLEDEIDLLCVHGILHLQGYDHVLDDEAKEMEDLQKDILDKWTTRRERDAE